MAKIKAVAIVLTAAASSHAFTIPQRYNSARQPIILCSKNDAGFDATTTADNSRRHFLATVVTSASAGISIFSSPSASYASGGATAGKYTTIPIAKRRYYVRPLLPKRQLDTIDFLLTVLCLSGQSSRGSARVFVDGTCCYQR